MAHGKAIRRGECRSGLHPGNDGPLASLDCFLVTALKPFGPGECWWDYIVTRKRPDA